MIYMYDTLVMLNKLKGEEYVNTLLSKGTMINKNNTVYLKINKTT